VFLGGGVVNPLSHRVADERGGVLVMFAVWLPVLLLFVTFVVDVANWFEHNRHLQLQADAAALAGAGSYQFPCNNTPIVQNTRNYAGAHSGFLTAQYNSQIGGTSPDNVHVLINSGDFWSNGGADFDDGGQPCSVGRIDVKITESNLPWFLRVANVAAINAWARVSIFQQTTRAGALPIGVPDIKPKTAIAYFVNETTQTPLTCASGSPPAAAWARLTQGATTTLNGRLLTQWDNVSAPACDLEGGVNISAAKVGVVLLLSGSQNFTPTGNLAADCDQALVECYADDGGGGWNGPLFIRGYSTAGDGTPSAPILRDVQLVNSGCGDGSAPYFVLNGNCTVGMKAKIDFGAVLPPGAVVKVAGPGCPNAGNPKGCPMTFDATTGYWETGATLPTIDSNAGAVTFDINWEDICILPNKKCNGTFTGVQRAFAATTALTGPVQFAKVAEAGTPGPSNSFAIGTGAKLVVAIGVIPSLGNASDATDPVVTLRVVGSRTQSVDCDPNIPNIKQEIAQGCAPTYTKNTGTACPSTAPQLWQPQPPAWDCTAIQTGGAIGQVTQGMEARILCGGDLQNCNNPGCTAPNHWRDNYPALPTLDPSDPRIVPVFLVPFGSFNGSGNAIVPVQDFATFYVTGWGGSGNNNGDPCPNADPASLPAGYISGHFIKYVDTINTGGGTTVCDPTSFGACVAVLTD
jgi:hypothetical protein